MSLPDYPTFYHRAVALLSGLFSTRWGLLIIAALALAVIAFFIPVLLRVLYFLLIIAFGFFLIVLAIKVLSVFLRP